MYLDKLTLHIFVDFSIQVLIYQGMVVKLRIQDLWIVKFRIQDLWTCLRWNPKKLYLNTIVSWPVSSSHQIVSTGLHVLSLLLGLEHISSLINEVEGGFESWAMTVAWARERHTWMEDQFNEESNWGIDDTDEMHGCPRIDAGLLLDLVRHKICTSSILSQKLVMVSGLRWNMVLCQWLSSDTWEVSMAARWSWWRPR